MIENEFLAELAILEDVWQGYLRALSRVLAIELDAEIMREQEAT